MKKLLSVLALLLGFYAVPAHAQNYVQSVTLNVSSVAVALGGMNQNSNVATHVYSWVVATPTGTVSACTFQLQTSTDGVSYSNAGTVQTCTSSGTYALSTTATYIRTNIATFTATLTATVQLNYFGFTAQQARADNVWWVPLQSCGMQLTTGALAAASTVAQNPGIQFVAAGNAVLAVTTSAAASAMTLDCDIMPPFRSTTGKGIIITGVNAFYGYQGAAALSTITGPTISSVTYSAAGGAAAATIVATAGGALTTTAGTSHSTPGAVTTTGQCYSEGTTFGTPTVVTSALARITYEEVFNHTTASLATYQLCGMSVSYIDVPQ